MDRRTSPRQQIRLAAKYSVPRLGIKLFPAKTIDMSRSGVLIEYSEETGAVNGSGYLSGCTVVIGDFIQVQIDLPKLQNFTPRCISCTGEVIRVDKASGQLLIAVGIRTMQFRDAEIDDFLPPMQQLTAFLT